MHRLFNITFTQYLPQFQYRMDSHLDVISSVLKEIILERVIWRDRLTSSVFTIFFEVTAKGMLFYNYNDSPVGGNLRKKADEEY